MGRTPHIQAGINVPEWKRELTTHCEGTSTIKITTTGIDLAKYVFQLHGVDEHGKTVLRKQVKRDHLAQQNSQPGIAQQQPSNQPRKNAFSSANQGLLLKQPWY